MGYKAAVNLQKLEFKVALGRHGGWRPFVSKQLACMVVLAFLGMHLGSLSLRAQTAIASSGALATITFANGSSVQVRTSKAKLPSVEILPGETVSVQMQLPRPFAANSALAQALDGGVVTQSIIVAADGTAFLEFHAGVQSGLYRILLSARDKSVLLQFWVQQP